MTSQAALFTRPGQELLDRLRGQDVTPARALRLAGELRGRYPRNSSQRR